MFALEPGLGRSAASPLRLLCMGAHSDDVEIGAGGTVLRLLAERPHTHVAYAVLSADAPREAEARQAAATLLAAAAETSFHFGRFRDGHLPYQASEVKTFAHEVLAPFRPHLVLTHAAGDAHQDHDFLARLAWQVFRGVTVAGFEIPKWDGDLARPNAYVTLSEAQAEAKLDLLARAFPSQRGKPWYDRETFAALLRLRGVEAAVRYAEAFHCAKLVW
ncbi:MAG: PIG-L deacetylase family protein [Rubricoccaceae bacterium]